MRPGKEKGSSVKDISMPPEFSNALEKLYLINTPKARTSWDKMNLSGKPHVCASPLLRGGKRIKDLYDF